MESLKKTRKIKAAKTALDLFPFEWKQYHPFTAGGRRYSMSARNVAGNIALLAGCSKVKTRSTDRKVEGCWRIERRADALISKGARS